MQWGTNLTAHYAFPRGQGHSETDYVSQNGIQLSI